MFIDTCQRVFGKRLNYYVLRQRKTFGLHEKRTRFKNEMQAEIPMPSLPIVKLGLEHFVSHDSHEALESPDSV